MLYKDRKLIFRFGRVFRKFLEWGIESLIRVGWGEIGRWGNKVGTIGNLWRNLVLKEGKL